MAKLDILIITPGIKNIDQLPVDRVFGNEPLVFLSNPLYQDRFRRFLPAKSTFVMDDDFIKNDQHMKDLVELSKYFAWNWYLQPGLCEELLYRKINLGCLFTNALTVYLVKVVKIVALYTSIFEHYPIQRISVIDDGSEWGAIAVRMASSLKIPFSRHCAKIPRGMPWKKTFSSMFKAIFKFTHSFLIGRWKTGGILYSSAFKFALPFFEKYGGGYYLRDAFSFEAWKASFHYSFTHIHPDYFTAETRESLLRLNIENVFSKIDVYFKKHSFFCYHQRELWPLICEDFKELLLKHAIQGAVLLDRFANMFATLKPRSVIVDEEVIFFNKALIAVANSLNIPTFCLVHGFPMESVGSIPSAAQKILAWGGSTKMQLLDWGIEEKRIVETGAPQFKLASQMDCQIAKKRVWKKFGLANNSKFILMTANPFYTNESPTFTRTSTAIMIQTKIIDIAAEILKRCPEINLLIKFHPCEDHVSFSYDRISQFHHETLSRVRFITHYDPSSLICASEVVLTAASTIYFDALLMRKPVFLMDLGTRIWSDRISREYLNIDHPDACVKRIVESLSPDVQDRMVQAQDSEIRLHFHQQNEHPVDAIFQLIDNQG